MVGNTTNTNTHHFKLRTEHLPGKVISNRDRRYWHWLTDEITQCNLKWRCQSTKLTVYFTTTVDVGGSGYIFLKQWFFASKLLNRNSLLFLALSITTIFSSPSRFLMDHLSTKNWRDDYPQKTWVIFGFRRLFYIMINRIAVLKETFI